MLLSRETRSLASNYRSIDKLDRRRSAELSRSQRRYDEHWGAAEKSDTRLKCGDGVIHHVHSQILSLWSPILRDMINLYPTPQLLESTHGLAYVLNVDEDGEVWAAVLDNIYPVTTTKPLDWGLLERCLLLADKYNMSCVLQRISSSLTSSSSSISSATFSMDPSQPNFALRWLALADQLQLQDVADKISLYLQSELYKPGNQPEALSAVLSHAHEHFSRQQQQQPSFPRPQQQQEPPVLSRDLQYWQHQQQYQCAFQQQHQQGFESPGFNSLLNPIPSPFSYTPGFCPSRPSEGSNSIGFSASGFRPLYQNNNLYPSAFVPALSSRSSEMASSVGRFDNASNTDSEASSGVTDYPSERLAICLSSGLFASPAAAAAAEAAAAAGQATVQDSSSNRSPPVSKALPCPVPYVPSSTSRSPFAAAAAAVPAAAAAADGEFGRFCCGVSAESDLSIADWMRDSLELQETDAMIS